MKGDRTQKKKFTKQFGTAIKEMRKAQGLKQKELAENLEISSNYVSMIERGEKFPSLDILERLASELGTDLQQMFLKASAPEVGEEFERAYHLAKIFEDVDFDKLEEIASTKNKSYKFG